MSASADAVEAVTAASAAALGDDAKPATLDRVRETLRGVGADDELRGEVAAGRVVHDREAVGFGGAPLVDVVPRASGSTRKRGSGTKRKATTGKPSESAPRGSVELREAKRALKDAERALARAEKHAANAVGRAEVARSEAERRERELADAEIVREARAADLTEARTQVERLV